MWTSSGFTAGHRRLLRHVNLGLCKHRQGELMADRHPHPRLVHRAQDQDERLNPSAPQDLPSSAKATPSQSAPPAPPPGDVGLPVAIGIRLDHGQQLAFGANIR